MIDFFAHHRTFNTLVNILYQNLIFLEKLPCKIKVFWSKLAKNDQKYRFLPQIRTML